MSSKLMGRLVIMTLAAALIAAILATSAFAQGNPSQDEYSDQSPRSPSSTETPPTSPTSKPSTATQNSQAAPATQSTAETTAPESTIGQRGGTPSITVNPTQGPPGTKVTVTGSGWGYPEVVEVYIGSHPVDSFAYESVVTDTNGNFRVDMTLSSHAPAGSTQVRAGSYYRSTEVPFTITQGDTGGDIDLAVTGLKTIEPPIDKPICARWLLTFQASIRNNGSKESGPFTIRFISDGTPDNVQARPSIPAGETHTRCCAQESCSG